MKRYKIYCLLLICTLLLPLLTQQPVQAGNGRKTIRVGFPEQHGMSETADDGTLSGYLYDYLEEISKYTRWEYKYVTTEGTLDEQIIQLMDMLEKGEIDILGGMVYNEEMAARFDYPAYNCGVSYYGLYALPTNTDVTSDNYFMKSPLRVSVYSRSGKINEKLAQFAEMSGIEVEQLFAASEEEQAEMLENGEADVMLAKDLSIDITKDYVTIAKFFPTSFYFAVAKGNKGIVNELNSVLSTISVYSPYFETNLRKKYFPENPGSIYFSREEQAYLDGQKSLKVIVMGGQAPIQYREKDGGGWGISLDLLEYAEELTGLEMEVVMTDDPEEYRQAVEGGEFDLAAGVTDELLQYDWQKMLVTIPYLEIPIMAVMNSGTDMTDLKGKKLAISEGISYDGVYDGIVDYYPTVEDCLKAVRSGKAVYTYANSFTAQYFLSNPQNKEFAAVPLVDGCNRKYCFGVISQDNIILLGILNKVIWNFQGEDLLQTYLYHNSYQIADMSFGEYIAARPVEFLFISVVFIALSAVAVLLLIRSRGRKNMRIRKMENQRYEQISEISNEFLFEYDIRQDILTMTADCSRFLKLPRVIRNFSLLTDRPVLREMIMKIEDGSREVELPACGEESRWVRVIMKSIADGHGRPVYLVGKLTDIQQEKEEKAVLLSKAEKDALTGVYNMAAFREKAKELLADGQGYAFFVIDIDHFKQVNDNFGHYIGDVVLSSIGQVLRDVFEEEREIAGRLGGDEFAALARYSGDVEQIQAKGELLCSRIREILFEGRRTPVTVSVGIGLTEQQGDYEALYRKADKILYEVKEGGRDGFMIR